MKKILNILFFASCYFHSYAISSWQLTMQIFADSVHNYEIFTYSCNLKNTNSFPQKFASRELKSNVYLEFSKDQINWISIALENYYQGGSNCRQGNNPLIAAGKNLLCTKDIFIPLNMVVGKDTNLIIGKYFVRAKCFPDSASKLAIYSNVQSLNVYNRFNKSIDQRAFDWLIKQNHPQFIYTLGERDFYIKKSNFQQYKNDALFIASNYKQSKFEIWAKMILAECDLYEIRLARNTELNSSQKEQVKKAIDVFYSVKSLINPTHEREKSKINDEMKIQLDEDLNKERDKDLLLLQANFKLLINIQFYNNKYKLDY